MFLWRYYVRYFEYLGIMSASSISINTLLLMEAAMKEKKGNIPQRPHGPSGRPDHQRQTV